jgi:hypothetical protein
MLSLFKLWDSAFAGQVAFSCEKKNFEKMQPQSSVLCPTVCKQEIPNN